MCLCRSSLDFNMKSLAATGADYRVLALLARQAERGFTLRALFIDVSLALGELFPLKTVEFSHL